MLTLGAERGAQVRVTAAGEDEGEAIAILEQAIRDGLGEEMPEGEPAPAETSGRAQEEVQAAAAAAEPRPASASARGKKPDPGDVVEGIAAAPGIAIKPVFHLRPSPVAVDGATFAGVEEEQARLREALAGAREQLSELGKQLARRAPDEAAIFEVHAEILDDPDLLDQVHGQIAEEQNAARAWQTAIKQRAEQVAALGDAPLAERAADLRDVGQRVLRLLVGESEGPALPNTRWPWTACIPRLPPRVTACTRPCCV